MEGSGKAQHEAGSGQGEGSLSSGCVFFVNAVAHSGHIRNLIQAQLLPYTNCCHAG